MQVYLVSFGVQLFPATGSKSAISFHQISRSTGERVRHQKVLESSVEKFSDGPAVPVEKDEIGGYEYHSSLEHGTRLDHSTEQVLSEFFRKRSFAYS